MPMWPCTSRNRQRRQLAALELCPLPRPLDLGQARKVLVFAPHPDDETLGCGGTLAQLANWCPVKVILVTDGSGAGGLPPGAGAIRQQEFLRALAILGVRDSQMLNYPDGAFDADSAFESTVRDVLNTYQPDWVILPSPLDYHRDHVRLSASLEPLCRACASVKRLLFYEIWAPVPATHIVDITPTHELKRQALACHVTALACGDYARAVEGLNRYRGLLLGRDRFAEAFWVESAEDKRGLFGEILRLGLALLSRIRDGA